jgi:hypothetical protein
MIDRVVMGLVGLVVTVVSWSSGRQRPFLTRLVGRNVFLYSFAVG